MGFDINKFENTSFKERTAEIKVPELKNFFGEDEPTVWIVRGVNAEELARVNEAVAANKDMASIISAISSNISKDKVDGIKNLMGLQGDSVPADIVRRIAMITAGSVSPVLPQDLVVKLGNSLPTTFYKISNKIIELTGMGQVGE